MNKKQLIMEKALDLFAKQGFEATSVQQITDYCGISKGAFYLVFKSKDELIIALIDHFMMQIVSDIDYVVKHKNDTQLLTEFYYTIYQSFYRQSDFAKVFMQEQSHSLNQQLIHKIRYYDKLVSNIILDMIDRLYGSEVQNTQYDLMYCIKGFINTYLQLFVFSNLPFDLKLLSESLVEKTNLLARHMTISFMSKELFQVIEPINDPITKEQLIEIVKQKIEEMEESIEKDSLILLKQQVLEPSFSGAIIKGLLENIRNHPHCKWISFLLRQYFAF